MGKVLYKTKFGKPIEEGKKYVIVLKNGTILDTIAREGNEDPNVLERFLSRTGATKYVLSMPKKTAVEPVPIKKEKTVKELEEEKIKVLNPMEQLDYVKNKENFKSWLNRNKFIVSTVGGLSISNFIRFNFNTSTTPYCCGGKEIGAHDGSIDSNATKYLTEDRLKILCTYIVKDFENLVRNRINNYGVISYVKNPGKIAEASARFGFLFDASDLFTKVSRFKNPNTDNYLDIYVISDKWMTNG